MHVAGFWIISNLQTVILSVSLSLCMHLSIGIYLLSLTALSLHNCQGLVENEVASKASPSPKGSINPDPNKFMQFIATYDTGGEQINKSFPTVADCCMWINKMDVATTAGALRKGLDAACKAKTADAAAQRNPCKFVYYVSICIYIYAYTLILYCI